MSNENYRLKKMALLIQEKNTVLDIGCAEKFNPYLFNKTVTGLDVKEVINMPDNYTGFIKGDVSSLAELCDQEYYDGIVAGEILEHLLDPVGFLNQCHKILNNNGMIVISTPNPNSPIERILTLNLSRKYFYTKDHVMLYPQRWLIRIMEMAGFKNINLFSGGFISPLNKLVPFPRAFCYQTIATGYKF